MYLTVRACIHASVLSALSWVSVNLCPSSVSTVRESTSFNLRIPTQKLSEKLKYFLRYGFRFWNGEFRGAYLS